MRIVLLTLAALFISANVFAQTYTQQTASKAAVQKRNIQIFKDSKRLKEQVAFVSKDQHIGSLQIVNGGTKNPSLVRWVGKGAALNKLCQRMVANPSQSQESGLQTEIITTDDGEECIKMGDKNFNLLVDSYSGGYDQLTIREKGLGLRNNRGQTFMVGDKIAALSKYYQAEMKKTKQIGSKTRGYMMTKVSMRSFSPVKQTDTYIYFFHRNGVIIEIGTWDQI